MRNLYRLVEPEPLRVIKTTNEDFLSAHSMQKHALRDAVYALREIRTIENPAGDSEQLAPEFHKAAVIVASITGLFYHSVERANRKWFYFKQDRDAPGTAFSRKEFDSLRHCLNLFSYEVGLDSRIQYELMEEPPIVHEVKGFASWS